MKLSRSHSRSAGFTLLEVMLAVALFALLIGGIFATQRGAMIIAANITESQEKSMRINSFVELMRRSFEQAPGNSRVHLLLPRGQSNTSEIYFKDYPLVFSWSGISAGSKGVIFRTERNAERQLSAVVLYLDEEATQDYENGKLDEKSTDHTTKKPHVRRLELMTGIKSLEWLVIDDSTIARNSRSGKTADDAWVAEWPLDKTTRPSRVKFTIALADNSDPMTLIFWIPMTVNPKTFANGGTGTPNGGSGKPPGINGQGGIPIPAPGGAGGAPGGAPGRPPGNPGGGGPPIRR